MLSSTNACSPGSDRFRDSRRESDSVGTIGADWYRRAAHPIKIHVPRKRKMNDLFVHIEIAPYGRKSTSGKGQSVMLFGAVDLDAKRERRRRNVGKGRNEIEYGSQGSV